MRWASSISPGTGRWSPGASWPPGYPRRLQCPTVSSEVSKGANGAATWACPAPTTARGWTGPGSCRLTMRGKFRRETLYSGRAPMAQWAFWRGFFKDPKQLAEPVAVMERMVPSLGKEALAKPMQFPERLQRAESNMSPSQVGVGNTSRRAPFHRRRSRRPVPPRQTAQEVLELVDRLDRCRRVVDRRRQRLDGDVEEAGSDTLGPAEGSLALQMDGGSPRPRQRVSAS